MTDQTITYAYVSDCQQESGEWTGARERAIAAACAEIGATELESGEYIYRADETGDYYTVAADDMAEYGAACLSDHAQDAYSIWCSGSGREATDAEIAEVAS